MKRRHFLHKSMGAAGLAGTSWLWSQATEEKQEIVKPQVMRPGDKVGLITPASSVSRDRFELCLANMAELGLEPVYTPNVRVKKGFLAGTDEQRLEDLHKMFADPEIKAVICIRGGYGASRILNRIDYNLIRKNPKALIGYSDITALHLALSTQAGLTSYHGPNGDSNYSEFALDCYKKLLFEADKGYEIDAKSELLPEEVRAEAFTVSPGKASGALTGGNLTLVSTLMGTPYEPDFSGKIVFLEDIGEAPYRIDRMLTQLILAGKFDKAKGIMLGIFVDCEVEEDDPDYPDTLSLKEVITERLKSLKLPCVYGMPFGHLADNAVIPMEVNAELDADKHKLRIAESAIKSR